MLRVNYSQMKMKQRLIPIRFELKQPLFLSHQPKTPFYVKGDAAVPYEKVVQAMVMLQAAGVPSVGLVTQPAPEEEQ